MLMSIVMRNCPSDIGIKIKDIRNKHSLSQDRFGKKLGLSGKTISSYETGRCAPPLRILKEISGTYDIPLVVVKEEKKQVITENISNIQKLLNELCSAFESSV
ncbi:MAG: transcriptional regulator [candidate division WWE3 bacterium GW2011_GWB1_41_6]|nr:MAG: transcriptional regulator [candidate division WWE3 bacterium GW2011_GWB1_41_6]